MWTWQPTNPKLHTWIHIGYARSLIIILECILGSLGFHRSWGSKAKKLETGPWNGRTSVEEQKQRIMIDSKTIIKWKIKIVRILFTRMYVMKACKNDSKWIFSATMHHRSKAICVPFTFALDLVRTRVPKSVLTRIVGPCNPSPMPIVIVLFMRCCSSV